MIDLLRDDQNPFGTVSEVSARAFHVKTHSGSLGVVLIFQRLHEMQTGSGVVCITCHAESCDHTRAALWHVSS